MDKEKKKALSTRDIIRINITKLREDNGLSMKSVAEAIGVNPNTYRVWEDEDEESGVKPYRLVQLAKIYGVSLDYIMLEHDNNTFTKNKNSNVLKVESPKLYNSDLYSEHYLSELNNYEKLLVMQSRRLSAEDKKRLNKLLAEMLEEMDELNK